MKESNNKENKIVTVIIVAHKRESYVLRAINSIIEQTVSDEHIEIILVKNFYNTKIDSRIESLGIKSIHTLEESLGAKISLGISKSKGDIVCFLEDDDEFFPQKIERILYLYNKYKIGYYHNNFKIQDSAGFPLNGHLSFSSLKYQSGLKNSQEAIKQINKLVKSGVSFNLSCIAVNRKIAIKISKLICNMTVALDNFLFLLSLDMRENAFFDPMELTKYRIHDSNDSFALTNNLKEFKNMKEKFLSNDLIGYSIIYANIENRDIKKFVQYKMELSANVLKLISPDFRIQSSNIIMKLKIAIVNKSILLIFLILLNIFVKFSVNIPVKLYWMYELWISPVTKRNK